MSLSVRKNRGGRPPTKTHKPGDRVPLSLRVTPSLKAAIDVACEDSGRSQSQEVEFRLEQSFERQELLYEAFEMTYGRQLAGLLMLGAGAMQYAMSIHNIAAADPEGNRSNAPRPQADGQLAKSYVFDDAVAALVQTIGYFRPASSEKLPTTASERIAALGFEDIGKTAAFETVTGALRPNPLARAPHPRSWEGKVREMVSGLGGWGAFAESEANLAAPTEQVPGKQRQSRRKP